MAKRPEQPSAGSPPGEREPHDASGRRRSSPLTDFHDASEPLHPPGFGEAPQAQLTGVPLSGKVSDWAADIAREAETAAPAATAPAKPKKKIPERSSAPTKTARGTSMGGAASARERAAAGLNPVAGLDIALEDAEQLSQSGVTATVAALSQL